MNLTEAEKGYLAGLLDGEGCVGYYCRYTKNQPYHSASLHICMTDKKPSEWLMAKVGFGKVSYSTKPGIRKAVYSWQLCNKPQVQAVLRLIRPLLLVKASQVDVLFDLWEAEKAFVERELSPELITIRQKAADQIKALKNSDTEGVETRRAGSLVDQGIVHPIENMKSMDQVL